jgi:hypothetical protein
VDEWYLASDLTLRERTNPDFDLKARFLERASGKKYFVVTLPDQFSSQSEIRKFVTRTYPVYERGDGYVIYDLEHPRTKP